MRKIEMKKIIKSRAGLSNYSAITNIKWRCVQGIGATKWNFLDDIITFDYKNNRYRLESRYTNKYSVIQEHKLVLLGETNS